MEKGFETLIGFIFEKVCEMSKDELDEIHMSGYTDKVFTTVYKPGKLASKLPILKDEVDVLSMKLGKTKLEEYRLRQILLSVARRRLDSDNRKKARDILEKVYCCRVINKEGTN